MKKKKPTQRAPSYQEEAKTELKKLRLATGEQSKLTKGPVVDSAATVGVWTASDSKTCDSIKELSNPITMETIDGETKSAKTASIKLPIMDIKDSVILDKV